MLWSLSVHLVAVDWDGSEAACLLPAAADGTQDPQKLCHFGFSFFSGQPQRFFVSVMLDRGIWFCRTGYLNGRSLAGRYRHKSKVFPLPFLAKLYYVYHLPFL